MILKIRAANPTATESWRYFDGVEGLHWSKYPYDGTQFPGGVMPPAEDAQRVEFLGETITDPGQIIFMSFASESTGPIEIWCNTTAYLLNDSGKTIERLI